MDSAEVASPGADLPAHYTHDGAQNHPRYPRRGALGTPRIRAHPALHSYIDLGDENDEPVWHHPRLDLPSARRILVELFQKVTPRRNERASQLLMSFGHFVTRDITRTTQTDKSRPMGIECDLVELRGPFCPAGQREMEFYRAARTYPGGDEEDESTVSRTGEPINFATSWLDMDHVYGNAPPSSPEYLKLRTGSGGKMKIDDTTGIPPIDPETGLYLVADTTMRRLPADFALLSTFLHYHNKRAEFHRQQHPEWDDEQLFRTARMDAIAVYQATYETKYIPAVLGDPLEPYEGYDPDVDASIDVFFSTSSFRYGHSGMSGLARFLDENWEPTPRDPMLMRDLWNKTEAIVPQLAKGGVREGMATVLRGLAHDVTRAPDAHFVDDITIFTGGSVVANLQRGRDNGIATYNGAREWFGLTRAESYLDVANGDEAVANMLEGLYGEGNVDDVDAYVGAMLENPVSKHRELGPLNEASMREQFTRLRDGDRLYYRARLNATEIAQLPTLSELIRDAWGDGDFWFPEDLFAIVPSGGGSGGGASLVGDGGSMDLFDGDLNVRWREETDHMVFTMSTLERVSGGYIGLGWGSTAMKGSTIWFCESSEEAGVFQEACAVPIDDDSSTTEPVKDSGPFSCCVAPGERHVRPVCGRDNYLTVLNSCASDEGSYVTVRAELCSGGESSSGNCFSPEGDVDFIAAYNPTDANAAHGFSRRTGGTTNLALGVAASCADDSAQAGLFALHGATLLIAWLFLAPIAIYVVRYYKHKSWRLRVHITLVGVIGGLMLTLVTAALVSVEGTSFGTVDAESSTFSKHKSFGLGIMVAVAFMVITGELRRKRTLAKRTKSMALERAVIISHRCGGLILTGCAWYNCYTGLVQISPYESDSVEVTFFSSRTVSMGYDLEFFAFIKQYLFFPWLAVVILTFVITEVRARRENLFGKSNNVEAVVQGTGSLLAMDDKDLPEMTVDNFLFLTRHGSALSLVDGYVIDIGSFIDVHPGGANVLRFAVGSDITRYFTGELDVGGQRHKHSKNALRALRPLVKWRMERQDIGSTLSVKKRGTVAQSKRRRGSVFNRHSLFQQKPDRSTALLGHVFRTAKVVAHEVISGDLASDEKCLIRLSLSLKTEARLDTVLGTPLPTSTFIFRALDDDGNSFERPYNTSRCYLAQGKKHSKSHQTLLPLFNKSLSQSSKGDTDTVYDFFISLVPRGKMSGFLATRTPGKPMMVKGPLASKPYLEKLAAKSWTNACLIVQGTGITPAVQLIDFFLKMESPPKITLVWMIQGEKGTFEEALNLPEREAISAHFRYQILGDGDALPEPTHSSDEDEAECEAREAFLRLYRTNGMLHQKTVSTLLSWLHAESDDAQRSLTERYSALDDGDKEGAEDPVNSNLERIGETLKTGLALEDKLMQDRESQCFRGSDAVSFLVDEYTPTRESALALGRELGAKLQLFEHVSDPTVLLLDDASLYIFLSEEETARTKKRRSLDSLRSSDGQNLRALGSRTRHLDLTQGFLVALCGHSSFESDMSDCLQTAGLVEEQIFRFPEGTVPLSKLSQFLPNNADLSSRSGNSGSTSKNFFGELDVSTESDPPPSQSSSSEMDKSTRKQRNHGAGAKEQSVRFDTAIGVVPIEE
ncbi:hypothetical protein ACHAXT_011605 [Thalassiosira profunda]